MASVSFLHPKFCPESRMGWFTTLTSLLKRNCNNNKGPFPYFLSFLLKSTSSTAPD